MLRMTWMGENTHPLKPHIDGLALGTRKKLWILTYIDESIFSNFFYWILGIENSIRKLKLNTSLTLRGLYMKLRSNWDHLKNITSSAISIIHGWDLGQFDFRRSSKAKKQSFYTNPHVSWHGWPQKHLKRWYSRWSNSGHNDFMPFLTIHLNLWLNSNPNSVGVFV